MNVDIDQLENAALSAQDNPPSPAIYPQCAIFAAGQLFEMQTRMPGIIQEAT